MVSETSRVVRNSICRIFLSISRGIMATPARLTSQGAACVGCYSRHGQLVEDFGDDGFTALLFGLRLIGHCYAVTQDVHADAFDVLGCHVAAAAQEGKGLGSQRQCDS